MANVHTFGDSHEVNLMIPPAAAGDTQSSWVSPFADGGSADRAVFMLVLGTISQTVNFKLEQATTSGGAGAKDITGAAITAITTTGDNSIATIEIAPGAMDDLNGFKFVRANIDFASATDHIWSLILIKHRLRYPGAFTQHATYVQQVVVL